MAVQLEPPPDQKTPFESYVWQKWFNAVRSLIVNSVGTVSSVGISLPSIFTVPGGPVTGSGTLTATLAAQPAATVFAGPPMGASAPPTFRVLVHTDLAAIPFPQNVTGFHAGLTAASAILLSVTTLQATTFPIGLAGSFVTADSAATAPVVLTVQQVSAAGTTTAIGTINFAAAAKTATFTFTAAVTTAIGDRIRILNAATADVTLSNIDFGLLGSFVI